MLVWQNFLQATWETIYTVWVAGSIGIVLGLCLGCSLFLTQPGKWWQHTWLHQILSALVNVVRSVPFIILLIAIVPLTRYLVGTAIGINAAIVPLAIATIPFYARLVQSALADLSPSLFESADAMGFNHWQALRCVILPQARAALIKAAGNTYITLVGYAAMAGAIGGGGLGQLAIDYGYERFDPQVMLWTVVILVVLVQCVQWGSDALSRTRKRLVAWIWIALLVFVALVVIQNRSATAPLHSKHIKLGVMSGLEQDALQAAVPLMQKKYGVKLTLVPFDDYAVPNAALAGGDIDANLFQHKPFLDQDVKAHGYHLRIVAKTFLFPLGFYSRKITNLSQLKPGAVIALASDPSNQGRALLLLQKHHLIGLKPGVGLDPSLLDINKNPLHLQFKAMNAAQLPRTLADADLVAINNAFLKPLGLTGKQAIVREGADVPYTNIVVVRQGDKRTQLWHELTDVLHSKQVTAAYSKRFPSLVVGW